jgi:hypothetical protein
VKTSRAAKGLAVLCIGLVLFAAFTPGVATASVAIVLDPVWSLFVPQPQVFAPPAAIRADEQTRALIAFVVSRPPPLLA